MGKLNDIIKADSSSLLIVSAADLKEFADGLIRATRAEAERQLQEQQQERFLTAKEAAEMLGVDATTLWRWRNKGYLHPVSIGSLTKYKLSDINAFIKSKEG